VMASRDDVSMAERINLSREFLMFVAAIAQMERK
jgi:hypothetical protein